MPGETDHPSRHGLGSAEQRSPDFLSSIICNPPHDAVLSHQRAKRWASASPFGYLLRR